MRWPRFAAAAALATAAVIGACTEVGTDPDAVVALAFDTLPYPSVVARDSMRDSLGKVAPFHAVAYNASGKIIANPALQYLALDTGVLVTSQGVLVANTRTSGTVRVVAASRGLQSPARTVLITRAPTALAASGKASDTLKYVVPDAATNAMALTVKLTGDSAGTASPVQGWLVSWRVTFRGQTVSPTDTSFVSLFDESSRVSTVDTTDASGVASRKLRIRANTLPAASDSFVVFASAQRKGTGVAGSPVRLVIHFRSKAAR